MKGFSEVIGSWKIIEMRRPRILRTSSSGNNRRSCPSNRTSPPTILSGRIRDQTDDRKVGNGFSGARLADNSDCFAAPDCEADAIDRFDGAVFGAEVGPQVFDFEQCSVKSVIKIVPCLFFVLRTLFFKFSVTEAQRRQI